MRPIDADALINDRENFIVIGAGDNICIDIADIAKAPTIEAEPVKHGRWIEDHDYLKCSECSVMVKRDFTFFDIGDWNYCPNCGARMDGAE